MADATQSDPWSAVATPAAQDPWAAVAKPAQVSQPSEPQVPQLPADASDGTGDTLIKNVVNSVTPYVMDRVSGLSGADKAVDQIKSAGTGIGQGLVATATVPLDVAHNVGEFAGNKIGKAITGVETQPQYSNYTGDAVKALGMDYRPKTAGGAIAQTEGQLAAPAVVKGAGTLAGKVVPSVETALQGASASSGADLEHVGSMMKARASESYKQSREAGAVLNDGAAQSLLSNVDDMLATTGKNNLRLHGDTLSVLGDLKQTVNGGPLSLEELDQYRQLLGDVVKKNTELGKMNPDALKASRAIDVIDKTVDGLKSDDLANGSMEAVDALNQGRSDWAQYRKFDRIANIVQTADGDPNRIKAGFQRFVAKPGNLKGYSPDEVSALRNAARTGVGENTLKAFGKFGFDFSSSGVGNTVLPALSAIAGTYGGVPGGIPLAVAGTGARQLQKLMARGKAQQALQALAQPNRFDLSDMLNDPRTADEMAKIPPFNGQ